MYKDAMKLGLRFVTRKGNLTIEDVYKLPLTSANTLTNLDDLYKDLHAKMKDTETVSIIKRTNRVDTINKLRFDILCDIIKDRLAEVETKQQAVKEKEREQMIMGIIADKEHEGMRNMSITELKEELKK